jgi:flagellin-specific chaperone FliS
MYNYLDTKYVILSSNKNNNYLLNIIKSINNTLNNDNKTTIANDIKEARYLFRDRINEIDNKKDYENEDEILNKAHYISTTSFESTYFVNMLILLLYIRGTIFFKIK